MKTIAKERRQVEIISLVQSSKKKFSVVDLCLHFNVEVATIHRDLQELRKLGIPIHSTHKSINIEKKLAEKELLLLLNQYFVHAGDSLAFPKSTSLLVKKRKTGAINIMVNLVNAIEKRDILEINYYKMFDNETVIRIIEPYELFSTTREWRLIARSDDTFKQFIVDNIDSVKPTGKKFKRLPDFNVEDVFRFSFKYWSGQESFTVVLQFDKDVAHVIQHGIWAEEQEIIPQEDGSVILKMKVNSLSQIEDWALTWGGYVKIIEPKDAKLEALEKAKAFLEKNNQ